MQELVGYSLRTLEGENVPAYTTSSFPLKVGYSLERCSLLLKELGIKQNKNEYVEDGDRFLQLFKLEWVSKISSICIKTIDVNKFTKVTLLPPTEDILKVNNHLKNEIPKLYESLLKEVTWEHLHLLAEAVSTRLTVFNKQRGNEVFQLMITCFKERKYEERWNCRNKKQVESFGESTDEKVRFMITSPIQSFVTRPTFGNW